MRSRLHELEADRATIKLLMEQSRELHDRIGEVANTVPEVAKRAAEETIAIVLRDREKITAVRDDQRRDKIKVVLQTIALCVAAGALIVAIWHP